MVAPMGMGLLHGFALKRALAALMLLAVLVRGVIPAGYMLAPSADGSRLLAITLCTGFGEAEAIMDLATGEVFAPDAAPKHDGDAPDAPSHDQAPCAFATASAVAGPPAHPETVIIALREEAAVVGHPVAPAPGRGLAAPPPARGPPLSA